MRLCKREHLPHCSPIAEEGSGDRQLVCNEVSWIEGHVWEAEKDQLPIFLQGIQQHLPIDFARGGA